MSHYGFIFLVDSIYYVYINFKLKFLNIKTPTCLMVLEKDSLGSIQIHGIGLNTRGKNTSV